MFIHSPTDLHRLLDTRLKKTTVITEDAEDELLILINNPNFIPVKI